MMEFKVGDSVKWNGIIATDKVSFRRPIGEFLSSKKVYVIRSIYVDNTCKLVGSEYWFNLYWFKLYESGSCKLEECGFVKGQDVEVSNYEDFSYSDVQEFYGYDKDLYNQYLTLSHSYRRIHDWKYCRTIN